MPPPLDAILFDIDDTLFSTSDFADRARRNAVQAMILHGLRMEPESVLRELREVISEFSSNYSSHFDKLLIRIPPECYAEVNPVILVAAGVIAYHETKSDELQAFTDVMRGLRRLARSPLKLGVISAGLQIKQAEKLLRLGVYPFMNQDAIFISDQLGISKPNPKLYRMACDRMNVIPERVMYVGDNPTHDIDPANQVGMVTVRSRRETRHATREGATQANYEIQSFDQIIELLQQDFGIQVPEMPTQGSPDPSNWSA